MDIVAIIAERKISEAMARGEFDNLPGRGKPLRIEDELPGVPAELRRKQRELQAKRLKLAITLRRPVHLDDEQLCQSPLTASGETRIIHPP